MMKVIGWILFVFGALALLGSLVGGGSIVGSLFWALLGVFLITRAKKKKQEQSAKEEWANKGNSKPLTDKDFVTEISEAGNLPVEQRNAIIKFMAYIQGTSPQSVYNEEANSIVQSVVQSLGLSKDDMASIVLNSMNNDPEQEIDKIMHGLSEIQDKNLVSELYSKSMRLAEISGDRETVGFVKRVFEELR